MAERTGLQVGIYVHHHGAGHRTRAEVLAAELERRGHRVTLLGSGLTREGVVPLDRDDTPPVDAADDAGGMLHWAPLHHKGFQSRMASISAWVAEAQPDVVVVDVSVEVTLLVRLLGVPVVVVGQPGDRTDEPHQLAYRAAAAVLAPWPDWLEPAAGLDGLGGRLRRVGGLSRYAGRAGDLAETPTQADGTVRGVMLCGSEGFDDPDLVDRIREARPVWEWTVLDGRVWVDDIGTVLADADVVVAHAGQNAVADLAALEVPAIVVPQQRPHDEQRSTAQALRRERITDAVLDPAGVDWGQRLDAALACKGGIGLRWRLWQTAGAVQRAVDVIEEVARGHRP